MIYLSRVETTNRCSSDQRQLNVEKGCILSAAKDVRWMRIVTPDRKDAALKQPQYR